MANRMLTTMMSGLSELRFEPTAKRVRAMVEGATIVDSTQAVLIWEPRRLVPAYAVPRQDVQGDLRPSAQQVTVDSSERGFRVPGMDGPPVLTPREPFAVHTADGEILDLNTFGARLDGVAFGMLDPDLAGYVILDFAAFDAWYEEDEPIVSHPRSPFTRIDLRQSSRHVRIELDGAVLADSTRPVMVFETGLPLRYYLPREDVSAALRPTPTRSTCAYKGEASYWSAEVGDRMVEDIAWSYQDPLRDVADLVGMVCFFDEKADLVVDGARRDRPVTPWS